MRILALGAELLALAAVVGAGAWAYLSLRRRQLGSARWEVVTRSLEAGPGDIDGVVVELQRPGERPQRVAVVPSALSYDEFSSSLAEAQAEAEAKAAALNASAPKSRR